jgi:hypothetical protein
MQAFTSLALPSPADVAGIIPHPLAGLALTAWVFEQPATPAPFAA